MPQIAPISLVAPGSRGLNSEKEFNLLGPEWATEANNCVISAGGRIAARKGWSRQTTLPIASVPDIDVIHEYVQKDGTKVVLSVAANKIYKNFSDYTDANNLITSTTAPTADHWQFVNFNDFVIGVQKGHAPIQWQNSGVFTDVSFTGTGYDGNCIAAGFGRVWAADADLQTLRYSSLLDHDDMSTTGGIIDMSSVWTNNMDQIVAIACLGANLIVFGKDHIVIWADGSGSEIGLDPNNMYVVDTIEGTGCIARDSIQAIGEGDLWFLSRHGVQSLKRVVQDKNNPLASVTKAIRTELAGYIETQRTGDTSYDQVRSVFSPENAMYLLNLPLAGKQIYIDTRRQFQDDDGERANAVTVWSMGGSPKDFLARDNGNLLISSAGVLGKYASNQDNNASYNMEFWSAWLNLGEFNERLKFLKEMSAIVRIGGSGTATYRWEFDFLGASSNKTITYTVPSASEWGIAEYGTAEYAGAFSIQRRNFPGTGQGQFIRVGSQVTVDGFDFILQQIQLLPKIGRPVA